MLYRKYRPKTFSGLVGQDHITKTLSGAVLSGRVGQAYLFCGPRGTGKTTAARLFAKLLNCSDVEKSGHAVEPCNKCQSCTEINDGRSMDLIEIDAASNRGIDEIRNLKESALVAAPGGKYKVFIIDEVHMLTKDAFNALLKILEEPPSHVIFILATTEPHKILPTVLSRVQRFDFKKLSHNNIVSKLRKIADLEKIKIGDDAISVIAASSDGALRDAEVALTKLRASSGNTIALADVTEALGLIPVTFYPEFLGYISQNKKIEAVQLIHRVADSGADIENFTKEFIEYLRKTLLIKIDPVVFASTGSYLSEYALAQTAGVDSAKIAKMISIFSIARNEIKLSPVPILPLELAVLELVQD
jgi:DNA polymerase-3 subunit gamma/tau